MATPRALHMVLSHTTALMIGIILAGLGTAVSAWTGPQNTPPTCVAGQTGCDAPLNVGTAAQVKNGALSVNAISIYGNTLLGGTADSNAYLNFGVTGGAVGYGLRDNAGTIEYKNSAGSWTSLASLGGAETDPQVGTLTANKWCTTDGTSVNCTTNAPVTAETDPTIGTLTANKLCSSTNTTSLNCNSASIVLATCTGTGVSDTCVPACPAGYTRVSNVNISSYDNWTGLALCIKY